MSFTIEDAERASRDPGALKEDRPPIMRFEHGTQKDSEASLKAERYVHMPCINVYVRAAGDSKTEVPYVAEGYTYELEKGKPVKKLVTPWLDQLKERKHHGRISQNYYDVCVQAFQRFKDGSGALIDGTPVKGWKQIHPAAQANLENLGISTIEMVAEMTEEAMTSFGMGARDIKRKAEEFVASISTTDSKIQDLQSELDNERKANKSQMSALEKKIAELEKKQKAA